LNNELELPKNSGVFFCYCFNVGQVQEKKVKKVCDLNMDLSRSVGNGPVVCSSISASSKPCMANGGCDERPFGYSSIDTSLPSGGLPSLRLPMVVVFNLILIFWHPMVLELRNNFA
jgi:hypothetical protein